jgi:hypothetical protein
MAVSNWEWAQITRANDFTFVTEPSGSGDYTRDNWVAIRARYSDEPYVSQLNETADYITAYNGGEEETVHGTTASGLRFVTDTNWSNPEWIWRPSGQTSRGYPIYIPPVGVTNQPNASKITIAWQLRYTGSADAWFIAEATEEQLYTTGVPWPQSSYVKAGDTNNPSPIFGKNFSSVVGTTFSGTSVADVTSLTNKWRCVTDTQRYDDRGVAWYVQEQVWRIQSGWVAVT